MIFGLCYMFHKCRDEGGVVMQKKYLAVEESLLEQINSGAYQPDEPIPPEREMAAMLGVNRMTLRRAVEELMYEGLLIRKKGSGTFLTKGKVSKQELITAAGGQEGASIKIISCKKCTEGNYGYKALQLDPQERKPYWRIRRVRYMDMVPYAYEDIYMNTDFFETIDSSFYNLGLQQIVKTKTEVEDIDLSAQVEALLCLHNTAVLLNVRIDSPILQIKSTFESKGKVMMFCRSYHPGDSYSYSSMKHRI